jgi:hypothetical protein
LKIFQNIKFGMILGCAPIETSIWIHLDWVFQVSSCQLAGETLPCT